MTLLGNKAYLSFLAVLKAGSPKSNASRVGFWWGFSWGLQMAAFVAFPRVHTLLVSLLIKTPVLSD